MHHQRNACAASTIANMGQPNAGMNWRCNTIGSARHPASRPTCRVTIAGECPAPNSAPPRVLLTVRLRSATSVSTSRSMATAPINSAYQVMVVSPPAQHDEFGAEAGAHRKHDSRAAAWWLLGDRVTEDVQHRRRRDVAELTQGAPRQF